MARGVTHPSPSRLSRLGGAAPRPVDYSINVGGRAPSDAIGAPLASARSIARTFVDSFCISFTASAATRLSQASRDHTSSAPR